MHFSGIEAASINVSASAWPTGRPKILRWSLSAWLTTQVGSSQSVLEIPCFRGENREFPGDCRVVPRNRSGRVEEIQCFRSGLRRKTNREINKMEQGGFVQFLR
jgi:hypothetical protein